MVRPAALYNKARFTRNYKSLGRVIAVLCKNANITKDDLNDAEKSALEELENENDEMERFKAKESARKADYRRRVRNVPKCPWDKTGRDGASAMSRVTEHTVPNIPTIPNIPTEHNNENRSDADTRVCTREGKSASASDRLNVFGMSGEEFFGGSHGTLELCKSALGNGFWAKAIRKLGEGKVLEELWTFVREVNSGEPVNNPGAAMTERFKQMGVN